jgi:diacylglycerol kinase (ATP)
MEKDRNILFLINPHSGFKLFTNLESRIAKYLINSTINPIIIKTEYAGHAFELTKKACEPDSEYEAIIAVGGDGTINEVVSGIGLSGKTMGIIPTGSGNGFARHLGISLFPMVALRTIIQFHTQQIDLMKIGKNKYGANVVGVGFDAAVSWRFKDSKLRGPISYVRIILEEFLNYQSNTYEIDLDGQIFTIESPMVTVANSSQFGNNAIIAPGASVMDGLLDLCIIKPFPKALSIELAGKIMTGQIKNSKYYEHYQGKKIIIRQEKAVYQIDGEPIKEKRKIKIAAKSQALKIIIPKKSLGKI